MCKMQSRFIVPEWRETLPKLSKSQRRESERESKGGRVREREMDKVHYNYKVVLIWGSIVPSSTDSNYGQVHRGTKATLG